MTISKAREGESHTVQAVFTDANGIPFSVNNVLATLFYYDLGERVVLAGPSLMTSTDESFRYVTAYAIPTGTAGKTLYVSVTAFRDSDDASVVFDQTILVDASLDQQKMRVSFTP